eukprot:NODE_35_length_36362_cov_0.944434.p27 type:complete len:163 gc:universal NODE_35_length_36362_cov_0.944434:16427-15939(-)
MIIIYPIFLVAKEETVTMVLLSISSIFGLTTAEIEQCARAKCDSITDSAANLECRSKCAQVPFGDSKVVDKQAQCQKSCGADANCYNSCIADFITQQGGKFVSSKNDGINDTLVVGNDSSSSNSSNSSSSANGNNSQNKSTSGVAGSVVISCIIGLSTIVLI